MTRRVALVGVVILAGLGVAVTAYLAHAAAVAGRPLPPGARLLCEHPDHPGDLRWAWAGRTDGRYFVCAMTDAPIRPRR